MVYFRECSGWNPLSKNIQLDTEDTFSCVSQLDDNTELFPDGICLLMDAGIAYHQEFLYAEQSKKLTIWFTFEKNNKQTVSSAIFSISSKSCGSMMVSVEILVHISVNTTGEYLGIVFAKDVNF